MMEIVKSQIKLGSFDSSPFLATAKPISSFFYPNSLNSKVICSSQWRSFHPPFPTLSCTMSCHLIPNPHLSTSFYLNYHHHFSSRRFLSGLYLTVVPSTRKREWFFFITLNYVTPSLKSSFAFPCICDWFQIPQYSPHCFCTIWPQPLLVPLFSSPASL